MDQLLTACYMQYRHVLNNKMRTDNAASNAKEVTRLFQYLTMVLMSTYHHADLTKKASAEALHDLFQVIVQILLGMVSHKMSLITIFGHKHFRKNFIKNWTFFY